METKRLWNNRDIEVVKIDGRWFALSGWNGEQYCDCWETDEDTVAIPSEKTYSIREICEYDEENDCYDVVGYEFV